MIRATSVLRLLPILGLLALAGCDDTDATALRGSVSRIYALDFVETRARLSASELSIEYVAGDGQVPVQIIARPPPDGAATVDLATDGDVLGRRDGIALPARKSGALVLLSFAPSEGGVVIGSFEAVLTTGETDYTLVGTFDTVVEDLRGL